MTPPIQIINNIQLPETSQQKQLPTSNVTNPNRRPQQVEAEILDEDDNSVGVFTLPVSPGVNWDALRLAIAGTCFFAAGLLIIQFILPGDRKTEPEPDEPTYTQSEVQSMLEQEHYRTLYEQQMIQNQQIRGEYGAFKDGVTYGN